MDRDDHLRQAAAALRQDLAAWAQALMPTERQSKLRCIERQLAILRPQDEHRYDDHPEPARTTQEDEAHA